MSRSPRPLALGIAALVAVPAIAVPAHAQERGTEARLGASTVRLSTVPRTPGIAIVTGGRRYVTGRDGTATVPVRTLRNAPPGNRGFRSLTRGTFRLGQTAATTATVRPRRLPGGGVARFDRYVARVIRLSLYYPFRPRFEGPDGRPVDPKLIQGYRLKSRTGAVINVKGARPVMIHATRVVPFTGRLVNKDVRWSIERVLIDGTNVVNRAEHRFAPRRLRGRPYRVRLLFYPVRVRSVDALFGFRLGRDLVLTYPSGVRRRLALSNGEVVIPALPRGTYQLKVNGPGVSPERPVAVSRPQDVRLQVISWLDIGLVGFVLLVTGVLLVVAPRPQLRRLPRRRRASPSSSPAQSGSPPQSAPTSGRARVD